MGLVVRVNPVGFVRYVLRVCWHPPMKEWPPSITYVIYVCQCLAMKKRFSDELGTESSV